MNILKKYGKIIGIFFLSIFLLSGILSIFNITNLIHSNITNTISFIMMIIILFLIGFFFGKKAEKKGYLEGIKIGCSLIFLLIMINLLFFQTGFSLERFIYYIVLILSSTLGSMLGINKKN